MKHILQTIDIITWVWDMKYEKHVQRYSLILSRNYEMFLTTSTDYVFLQVCPSVPLCINLICCASVTSHVYLYKCICISSALVIFTKLDCHFSHGFIQMSMTIDT